MRRVPLLREAGGYFTLFDTDEEAVNAVLNGQVDGYLSFETRANFFANHEYSGKVSVYASRLKTHFYALAVPRQSRLRRLINVAALRLMGDSIWESLLDRYGLERRFGQTGRPWPQESRR